jgi:hypothetical protein
MTPDSFKVCSICRKPIAYGAKYFLCSVSTCRTTRTGLFFCSLPCFEAHVPELRHRDAWAEEEQAPTREQAAKAARDEARAPAPAPVQRTSPQQAPRPPAPAATSSRADDPTRRRIVGQSDDGSNPGTGGHRSSDDDKEILVVVSKLKKFIRDQSGMNTSDTAVPVLSDHLRWLSIEALRKAAEDGRKTVMDRDYEAVIKMLRRPG